MTPAVRRLVSEHQIDLAAVTATGRDGRILKEDVLGYLEDKSSPKPRAVPASTKPSASQSQQSAPVVPTAVPTAISAPPHMQSPPAVQGVDVTVPIRGIQRAMVKSMTASLQVCVVLIYRHIHFVAPHCKGANVRLL